MNDHELLQQFLTDRSEPAFAELVRRNVDLVFSAALRQTGNQALAEDVTQTVFVLLSRKAQSIRRGEALAGWLLVTTRYAARNALRSESRRRRHEQGAAAMKSEIEASDESNWHSIKPLLDDAVARLKRDDRDAITLRYFKGYSLSQLGEALGISEAAAQKRVSRALERLRIFFGRSRVTVTSEGLASLLALHVTTAAPINLTAQIVQHALIPTLAKTKGAAILMAATKTKIAIASVAIILIAGVSLRAVYKYVHVSGKPVTAPTIAPAASAPMSGAIARDILAATYGLQPDENLKRIQPPFPPERLAYYRSINTNEDLIDPPVVWFFKWDEQGFQSGNENMIHSSSPPDVRTLLTTILDIWSQNTDLTPAILSRKVPGDWVTRASASQMSLIDEFVKSIPEVFGMGVTLRTEMVDREVIVVQGEAKFATLPDLSEYERQFNQLRVSLTPSLANRYESGAGHNTTTVLLMIGETLRRPIVIETTLNAKTLGGWHIDPSADFRDATEPPNGEVVDKVLAIVAEQTSLSLKREHRTVPIWRLVPANP